MLRTKVLRSVSARKDVQNLFNIYGLECDDIYLKHCDYVLGAYCDDVLVHCATIINHKGDEFYLDYILGDVDTVNFLEIVVEFLTLKANSNVFSLYTITDNKKLIKELEKAYFMYETMDTYVRLCEVKCV